MIGVIADDLTGATELGAVGVRLGLRAEVVLAGRLGADADLICVDTDSRNSAPDMAARRVAEAVKLLQAVGVKWIYKKTDSILRGNVTAELEAAVAQLGLNGAVLVPANPSLGRTIVDGEYFVRGQRIHETDFSRDPQHPRLSPKVIELIASSAKLPVSVHKSHGILPAQGIILGEAPDSDAVRLWAEHLKGVDHGWLAAGGAELFTNLVKQWSGAGDVGHSSSAQTALDPAGAELFVCGSASESTKRFVAAQQPRGVAMFHLPERLQTGRAMVPAELHGIAAEIAETLATRQRVVLQIGLPLARELAGFYGAELVRLAAEVLQRTKVAKVFAEGGATAVALARQMGWSRLPVVGELAPGVAVLAVGDGRGRLIVKPGSYAWPEAVRGGK